MPCPGKVWGVEALERVEGVLNQLRAGSSRPRPERLTVQAHCTSDSQTINSKVLDFKDNYYNDIIAFCHSMDM